MLSIKDKAEITGLRDVAVAINCETCKWTLTGDNDMRISYKGWFVFSQPYVCWSLAGFVVVAIGTAAGGRLSGWELTY